MREEKTTLISVIVPDACNYISDHPRGVEIANNSGRALIFDVIDVPPLPPKKKKKHAIGWAVKQLKRGRSVTRKAWGPDQVIHSCDALSGTLAIESLVADDWELWSERLKTAHDAP